MSTAAFPSLVIIGPPKAGTTSVARWLEQRSDIALPARKELWYLNNNWHRGIDWYRAQFPVTPATQFTVEATPTYFADRNAPARAAEAFADTVYLVILRDPAARAWSHYGYQPRATRRSVDNRQHLEDVIDDELARGLPDDGILTHGRYAHHLDRWADSVGRDRIMLTTIEDVAQRPVGVFEDICRHMGAPGHPVPRRIGKVYNPGHRLRSIRLNNLMLRHRLWRRLPFRLGFAIDRFNRVRVPNPPMPDEVRARLNDVYADDIAELRARWLSGATPAWAASASSQ